MNGRMRTQLNRALAVLALTAGAASANPSAPVIQTTWDSPTSQATPTIQWTDATFDPLALNDRYYDLRIVNVSWRTETHVRVPVPVSPTGAVSAQIPPLEPYSDYLFFVHANERDSLPCGSFPFPNCQYGPGPESAPTTLLTFDPDRPVVDTFVVPSSVNTPLVLAQVNVYDYAYYPGIGRVTGVEFTGASSFSCSAIAPAFSCFIPNPGGARLGRRRSISTEHRSRWPSNTHGTLSGLRPTGVQSLLRLLRLQSPGPRLDDANADGTSRHA